MPVLHDRIALLWELHCCGRRWIPSNPSIRLSPCWQTISGDGWTDFSLRTGPIGNNRWATRDDSN